MTRLPMIAAAVGMATTAISTGSPSNASAETFLVQQADREDMARTRTRNGVEVLRATDEEMTNEQASFGIDRNDPTRGVVVMMSTGQLDGAAGPNQGDTIEVGHMQGACMPFSIDKDETTETGIRITPIVDDFKYITQRQADDYRAFNNPEVVPLEPGYFAVLANWDRNDNTNTERYVQVVDSQCNLMTLTGNTERRENNTSAVIMAKNNDNCSGHQAGGGASSYMVDGTVHVHAAELCNGNGRDDGWWNYYTLTNEGNGVFDVTKMRDESFIRREERSRGRCEAMDLDGNPGMDTAVCCGTEGNSQPQREGVWCQGTDIDSGDVLWKEQVAYRGETSEGQRTYAMRIKSLAERDLEGNLTGNLVIQYQMHRGRNNGDRKGGYDDKILISVATPSREGLNMGPEQDITQDVIDSQLEMTHATVFQSFTGTVSNPQPAFSYFSGNHNANQIPAHVLNVSMSADRAFRALPKTNLAGPADAQKYSKYLGNNPNNQGRNFIECRTISNPYAGDADGKAAGIPVFNACAVTGKLTSPGEPQYKPDLFFEVWSTLSQDPTDDPGDDDGGDDGGTDEGDNGGDEGGTTPNELGGGCSTTGSTGGLASLLVVGLVLGFRRRRS